MKNKETIIEEVRKVKYELTRKVDNLQFELSKDNWEDAYEICLQIIVNVAAIESAIRILDEQS